MIKLDKNATTPDAETAERVAEALLNYTNLAESGVKDVYTLVSGMCLAISAIANHINAKEKEG